MTLGVDFDGLWRLWDLEKVGRWLGCVGGTGRLACGASSVGARNLKLIVYDLWWDLGVGIGKVGVVSSPWAGNVSLIVPFGWWW